MKTIFTSQLVPCLLFAGGLLAGTNCAAAENVVISFEKPETFRDMPFETYDKEQVLKTIAEHFVKLGTKIPQDQTLKIVVTDMDLAGRMELGVRHGSPYIRVLRGGVDWPSMRLRYTLESKGVVLQSGEERLADMNYLYHYNRYSANETLRYEKNMVETWFKQKFADVHQ